MPGINRIIMHKDRELIISAPQMAILQSTKQVNLFLAGVGSGKTFLGGLASYRLLSMFPDVDGFIGANTYDQLNTSTFKGIRSAWALIGMHEYQPDTGLGHFVVGKQPPEGFRRGKHHFMNYRNIVSFSWGPVLYLGSLDNARAHEGKQFGWAVLDETKDSREEDVKEVILSRLRQQGIYIRQGELCKDGGQPHNPLYILTSPARSDWLNQWFRLDSDMAAIQEKIYREGGFYRHSFDNKAVVISSTHHNLHNLPANFIENKRYDYSSEQFNRLIYGDPFQKTGGEFWTSFRRAEHTGNVSPQPGVPVHISVDQNVNPYYSMTCWQIIHEQGQYNIHCFDEICLPHPRNTTEAVCRELARRWGPYLKAGLFYYGDASGRKRDTRGSRHDYQILADTLAPYLNANSDRTTRRNPEVLRSRNFINRVLDGKLNLRIRIGSHCTHLIADMEYLKEDATGGILKQKARDKSTGASYEKYGHASDTMRYFITSAFRKMYEG